MAARRYVLGTMPLRRSPRRRVLRRLVSPPLAFLAVLAMLAEEYLWKGLVRLGAWAGRLPLVRRVERRIAALPPAGAVAMLFAPVGLAVPAKLAAVWAIANGHALLGLGVLLGVKICGTAIVARIYTLCEASLMTVGWFVRLRAAILAAKAWAHRKLEATAAWRTAQRLRDGLRRLLRPGRRRPAAPSSHLAGRQPH